MNTQSILVRPDLSSSETSSTGEIVQVRAQGESYRPTVTIGGLTDDVLLDIFDFYRDHDYLIRGGLVWRWHVLVHVCRRWRQIIFESPHRLNLQILCTHKTPVRKNLNIWPAFPIVISYVYPCQWWGIPPSNDEEDNIIAAFEHPDRVCYIRLDVTGSELAKTRMVTVMALMEKPFPVLKHLAINASDEEEHVVRIPCGLLGGSAPCLQELHVYGIPYPALPTLLLSTNDLVTLHLCDIPLAGYISLEVMVACLAALPKLETLHIRVKFRSAFPCPDQIRLPPITRIVLPALISFEFRGDNEYLEDLVAQIDSPRLSQICIGYLDRLVDFQAPQLSKFIDRSMGPKLTLLKHAQVGFFTNSISFIMSDWDPETMSTISFSLGGPGWQASPIVELLGQFSAILSNVVHLKLEGWSKPEEELPLLVETDDVTVEWLHLLRQFSAVQTLHVSYELADSVALALEDIAGENREMVTQLSSSLNLIYFEDQSASSVRMFVAACELLSDRPVTVVDTIAEFSKRLESSVGKCQFELLYPL